MRWSVGVKIAAMEAIAIIALRDYWFRELLFH